MTFNKIPTLKKYISDIDFCDKYDWLCKRTTIYWVEEACRMQETWICK